MILYIALGSEDDDASCHIIEGYYFNNGRAVLENCFKLLLFLNIMKR